MVKKFNLVAFGTLSYLCAYNLHQECNAKGGVLRIHESFLPPGTATFLEDVHEGIIRL